MKRGQEGQMDTTHSYSSPWAHGESLIHSLFLLKPPTTSRMHPSPLCTPLPHPSIPIEVPRCAPRVYRKARGNRQAVGNRAINEGYCDVAAAISIDVHDPAKLRGGARTRSSNCRHTGERGGSQKRHAHRHVVGVCGHAFARHHRGCEQLSGKWGDPTS